MKTEGKYIYCIIPTDEAKLFNVPGISGREVDNISYQGLSAVVSNAPLAKCELSPATLLAHQLVIEEVMKEYPVLPVSFYTIAESVEDIIRFLELRHTEFMGMLHDLKSKVEIGVEVFWKDMKKIYERIVDNNLEIKELRLKYAQLQQNELIQMGKDVANALERQKDDDADVWLHRLMSSSCKYKILKKHADNMVLNAVFLVEDIRQQEFDDAVEELADKYSDIFDTRYIGPTPPYNFVNIKLHLDDLRQ